MPLPYCVYVLFSQKDALLYIGFSSNLPKRLKKHSTGGVKSTASRLPLELVFCEFYIFKKDAMKRERYFKTGMGKKAIKLMLVSTLRSLGYKGGLKDKELPVLFDERDGED